MAKILLIDGENVKALDKIKFTEEGKLQDYLEKYPSLIPLADIVEGASDLWCIGREVSAGPGAIDLLFIDKDGLLTIVETKLVKNPGIRREVIGQVIEYASYISQWTADDVYRIANKYGKSLDEVIGDVGEDFRSNIERNLKDGKMRLIIAVDELIEPLRATVTFLNRNSTFDILLLQVSSFESGTQKVLMPSLFGYKPPRPPEDRHYWTEAEFLEKVKSCEKDVAEIIRKLLEFAKSYGKVKWGTGTVTGSFTFNEPKMGLSIFSVYSNGNMSLNPGWMSAWRKVKKREEILEAFRTELNQIPGINILPEGAFYQTGVALPPQKVQFLTQGNNLEQFKSAVLSLCQAIEPEEQ